MWPKIWAIAWNNLYRTYTDRIALLFMVLMPVAISLVMGLAFGNFDDEIDVPDSKIIVINQDQGATTADGREVNWGRDLFLEILVKNTPESLAKFVDGEESTDIEAAHRQVTDGDARAALVIPADFSANLTTNAGTAEVELFYNPGSEVGSTVVVSVVEALVANLNNGQAAEKVLLGAADGYLFRLAQETGNMDAIARVASAAIAEIYRGPDSSIIQLETVNVEGKDQSFEPLQYFAPSMAIFFMTFAMAAGTRSILEEQQGWTLQRILTTPTPRWVYMAGKLLGTYLSGLLQMLILLITMPVFAVLLGDSAQVWGENYPGVALMTLAVVATGTGLGLLLAALSKTSRQADTYGTPVLIIMAAVGGTFFTLETAPRLLRLLSNLSLNKWGLDGFVALSTDDASLSDILPNIAALLAMAMAFFVVALWRFNRRVDI